MTGEREKWNRKYRERRFSPRPSAIVQEFGDRAVVGRALDLACGTGRNACFLAERGFQVDAVDISEEGLRRFACRHPAVNRICQDLATFAIPARRYQLILNIRFLQRRLFAAIQEGLSPGGILIFETYLLDEQDAAGHRFRREHLLRGRELCTAFRQLETIVYREGPSRSAEAPARQASLVALRPLSA